MDITLHAHSKSKTRLKSVLKPMREEYEYLCLDTPPGITLVADNVFRASDMVLVPVIPTTLSVLTYETLTTFFEKHVLDQQKLYAFFSMVEKRKTMHRDIMRSLSTGDRRFLRAAIPYAADVEKMGVHREPVFCFSATSAAAHAYKNLWREVKKKAHE